MRITPTPSPGRRASTSISASRTNVRPKARRPQPTRRCPALPNTDGFQRDKRLERSLVPLRASVRDYEVRRIRAERKAAALVSEAAPQHGTRGIAGAWSRTNVSTSFETWVVSHDGSVGGYIDRVRDTPAGPVLVDYKSGVITEKAGAETIVKERYQIQLKLYAALYAETFGQWPAGLEIVPIEGAARAIPFTPDECLALLNEANKTLGRVNEAIARAARVASRMHRDELLANPDPVTCSSCSYRPVCRAYQRACTQGDDGWPVDVRGQVVSIQPLFNGRIGLIVAGDGGATMRVRSLCRSDIRHPALSLLKTGDHIAAYNLDGRQGPHIFSETPLTILYRCSNGDTP